MQPGERVFRDRDKELGSLQEMYDRRGGQLLLVFGRRRVGKSRLLREFAKNKPAIFYQASTESEAAQVEKFSGQLADYFGDSPPERFSGWSAALERLLRRASKEPGRHLVIFDEFQNMVDQNQAIPSILQGLWDEMGESSEMMVVLCGSIVSELNRLRQGSEPLYGRFSGVYKIKPFSFQQASLFFPGKNLEHRVRFYGVLGGMPMYLNLAGSYESVWRLVEKEFLDPMKILYEEVPLLLSQELREPAKFMTILSLISRGLTRLPQIGSSMAMSTGILSHYLSQLVEMDLLERQVPVTEGSTERSRKGSYELKDNFVRFWFRFLFPYKHLVERGEGAAVMSIVRRDFDTFIGPVAEEIARETVRRASAVGDLPAQFDRVGRYWDRKVEIDICGIPEGGGPYLWGECKWKSSRVGGKEYHALKEKVAASGVNAGGKNLFLLCSRSGFAQELRKLALGEGTILWDAEAMEQILS